MYLNFMISMNFIQFISEFKIKLNTFLLKLNFKIQMYNTKHTVKIKYLYIRVYVTANK